MFPQKRHRGGSRRQASVSIDQSILAQQKKSQQTHLDDDWTGSFLPPCLPSRSWIIALCMHTPPCFFILPVSSLLFCFVLSLEAPQPCNSRYYCTHTSVPQIRLCDDGWVTSTTRRTHAVSERTRDVAILHHVRRFITQQQQQTLNHQIRPAPSLSSLK